METGRASKTALGVAIRRAAHQLMEQPRILDDPIALRLVGSGHPRLMERAMHPVGRDFRAFMAVRSRYVEDQLAQAVQQGIRQYVVLGAGLDTFAYRNPFPDLKVFEVDFPATQQWKREMLAEAAIALPEGLTFVPLDFEHHTLKEGLGESGFDFLQAAFFGWLGVIPYLTLEAFRSTVAAIGRLPAGTAVGFDYGLRPEMLSPTGRKAWDALSARVAAAGEPFQLFFSPEELESELLRAGFRRVEQLDYEQLNEQYFNGRADGMRLSDVGMAMLATGWV